MRSPGFRKSRGADVSASLAHLLAWAAFLWIALWPYAYQGVTATPVDATSPSEAATGTERLSASYVEVNGLVLLLPMFVPVLFTALALLLVLTGGRWPAGRVVVLWLVAACLLGFCVLGYLSFGILYLPAALASVVTAALSTRRRLA